MTRHEAIDRFLAASGRKGAARTAIAGDASFRRYERISHNDESAILMDAPPSHEDVRPFLAILHYLRHLGFSAPALLAQDIKAGFLLLEDLDDNSFNRVIDTHPHLEETLYETAVDLLCDLHRHTPPPTLPIAAGEAGHRLLPYDDALLLKEAALFTDWYLPAIDNRYDTQASKAAFIDRWMALFTSLDHDPRVLVLRDYHADNLMWLPDRSALARIGLLDFQDAVIGHPAYDLVSLLQDARRDVPPELEEAMIVRYLENVGRTEPAFQPDRFRRAYKILGAQRATKIIGIFTRLYRRDEKPRYLALIPRVWGLLERNLAGTECDGLKAWLQNAVPLHIRRNPPFMP